MAPHIALSLGMSSPRSLLQPTRELWDTKSFLYNARIQLQVVHRSKRTPQVASLISADLISITHPRFSRLYRTMETRWETRWRTLTLLGRPLNVQPHCCVVDGAMLCSGIAIGTPVDRYQKFKITLGMNRFSFLGQCQGS